MSLLWIVLAILPILGGAERFNCRGRILGAYYADAKSGCKAFHVCVRVAGGGIRDFRFFCPPGTLFHQEAQTCTDWGDDDPLACPADLYDGSFDLYRIGSGLDTKKLSSPSNREDEPEYGLQRAETGDRRLQNSGSGSGSSDLRASHSSDFFSGQRDRGRDDPAPSSAPVAPAQAPRQSFRRPTTPRSSPSTVQYTQPPQYSNQPQYDPPKRKLVRKRPVYVSSVAPSTFPPSTPQPNYPSTPVNFVQSTPPSFPLNTASPQSFNEPQQNYRRIPQNRQTPAPPANVPPQYKDEYVEVSRVTPKQSRFYNSVTPTQFSKTTPASPKNKDALAEVYNYDAQSTPGINNNNNNNNNKPFKVRNSFNVQPETPKQNDYFRAKNANFNNNARSTTSAEYTTPSQGPPSTPAYKNFNSVSYEPEKNNYVSYSNAKQNYYTPTTQGPSTVYTSTRPAPSNLNTIAYNTNLALNTNSANFAESDEDDGQYRPPQGEDDGQYRPELYERELLSGAHSLNIAASGNRLPEDQKPRKIHHEKQLGQTSPPRPFRPAPTAAAPTTTRAPEPTTVRPSNPQRNFDYFQPYTTTSRPVELVSSVAPSTAHSAPPRPASSPAPAPRPQPRPAPSAPPAPPAPPSPSPSTKPPSFAKPANNKEDTSYDYAYYDSDPGFTEYDHIEEFGKTKTKA